MDSYNSLEIGFSTFFLNRTNRSGIIDKAGPIGGFSQQGDYPINCRFNKERLVAQIKKIGEKRDSIKVYNLEALDFIDDVILKTRKAFIFFDPPYYGKGPGLYTNFYCHGDHANLAQAILEKLKSTLEANKPARVIEFSKEEMDVVKQYTLLTMKPIIYVANLGEEDLEDPTTNPHYNKVVEFAAGEGADVVPICAKIESELVGMDKEEKDLFLQDLGIEESGLDKLIKEAYKLLGLRTYFTAGVQEVRAWTFKEGMTAPEMAGIIHSDFQRGFIKAETYSFDDLVEYGSEHALKEAGKIRQEGKQYVGQDGDIMLFKFNV